MDESEIFIKFTHDGVYYQLIVGVCSENSNYAYWTNVDENLGYVTEGSGLSYKFAIAVNPFRRRANIYEEGAISPFTTLHF